MSLLDLVCFSGGAEVGVGLSYEGAKDFSYVTWLRQSHRESRNVAIRPAGQLPACLRIA